MVNEDHNKNPEEGQNGNDSSRGVFIFKGMKTSYKEYGNPDAESTIVLVHGFGANAEYWRAVYPEISKQYRVIGIDLLGYGQSYKPTDVEMSIDLWTQQI